MKSNIIELTRIETEENSIQSFYSEKINDYTSSQDLQDLELYKKVDHKRNSNLLKEDLNTTELREKNDIIPQRDRKLIERQAVLQVWADKEEDLIQERSQIMKDKFFGDGISKDKARRVKHIDWMLDRIDDAKSGEYLDMVESTVKSQKSISNDLTTFLDAVEKIRQKKPRKNKC